VWIGVASGTILCRAKWALDALKIHRQQIDILLLLIRAKRENFYTVVKILCGEAAILVVILLFKPLLDVMRRDRRCACAFWTSELGLIHHTVGDKVLHMSSTTANSGPMVAVICDCISD
jgi:hypothetical protein